MRANRFRSSSQNPNLSIRPHLHRNAQKTPETRSSTLKTPKNEAKKDMPDVHLLKTAKQPRFFAHQLLQFSHNGRVMEVVLVKVVVEIQKNIVLVCCADRECWY